jgi:hypothetical protein
MSSPSRTQADLFGHVPPEKPRREARPFDVEQVARAVWRSGVDPGTLTEDYLAALGLPLTDELRGRVIRHHPSLSFAKDHRLPGMLTLLRDIHDDRPCAVVRTYLDEHARKIAQRILGPAYRAAAKLDPAPHVEDRLHVTVGIEAGIAAMLHFRPIWAIANAEAPANLELLAGIRSLTVLIDPGDGNATRIAAAAAARWKRSGRIARVIEMSGAAS